MNTFIKSSLVVLTVAAFLMVTSCKNQEPANNVPASTLVTSEDSLYQSVLALHDEAMPKMGALIGLQKKAQIQIDSLKKLGNTNLLSLIQQLEQVKLKLANAEKGMNDWMAQFEPDPTMPTSEERAAYFASQKAKAKAMRDEIMAALDSAAASIK